MKFHLPEPGGMYVLLTQQDRVHAMLVVDTILAPDDGPRHTPPSQRLTLEIDFLHASASMRRRKVTYTSFRQRLRAAKVATRYVAVADAQTNEPLS